MNKFTNILDKIIESVKDRDLSDYAFFCSKYFECNISNYKGFPVYFFNMIDKENICFTKDTLHFDDDKILNKLKEVPKSPFEAEMYYKRKREKEKEIKSRNSNNHKKKYLNFLHWVSENHYRLYNVTNGYHYYKNDYANHTSEELYNIYLSENNS